MDAPVLELPLTRLKVVGANIVHATSAGVCCFSIPLRDVDRVELQPDFEWSVLWGMVLWALGACVATRFVPEMGWVYLIWMVWTSFALGAIVAFLTAKKLVLLSNGEPVAVPVKDPVGVVAGFVQTVERLLTDFKRS